LDNIDHIAGIAIMTKPTKNPPTINNHNHGLNAAISKATNPKKKETDITFLSPNCNHPITHKRGRSGQSKGTYD
jgi:hypothetical protein